MAARKWAQVFSLLRLCSSPGVETEGRGERLGIRGMLVPGIQGKVESRSCLPSSLSHSSGPHVKQTVAARQAVCLSAWRSGRGSIHPEDLTHTCPSPCPLYSLHPRLLTSVSNYSPLSLAQCLSSESLWKGRGNGCRRNKASNTRSIKIQGKSEKGKCRQDFSL